MSIVKKEWATISELKVRWGDMDAFNHINNTVYFKYFETARIDYFHHINWEIEDNHLQFGPILAHTSCQFIKAVKHPDNLSIGVRTKSLGQTSILHEYAIYSDRLGLVAKGDAVIVCFDFNNNKKITIPESLKESILNIEPFL